jgi:hypothetical protein
MSGFRMVGLSDAWFFKINYLNTGLCVYSNLVEKQLSAHANVSYIETSKKRYKYFYLQHL